MRRIYAVGETLLDLIFRNSQPVAASPGGSCFNSAISLGRLGAPVSLVSEMGKDRVGNMITAFLVDNGVDTTCIYRYEQGSSPLALAFLNERNDAEYQFYKDYPEQRLNIEFPEFEADDLVLFASFYALDPDIRPRVKDLLNRASTAGSTLVYDPNFRTAHLSEREHLLPCVIENLQYADIVRASDEDIQNIFGVGSPDEAWELISPHCPVLIYTTGGNSVKLRSRKVSLEVPVKQIQAVSSIGAGDTFNAGLLHGLWESRIRQEVIQELDKETWKRLLIRAISFAREVCLSYENYLPLDFISQMGKSTKILED